jgi:hypothetical protein
MKINKRRPPDPSSHITITLHKHMLNQFSVAVLISSDSASKMNVPGHDGHPAGVNAAEIYVFKQLDQVSLRSFLKGSKRRGLEPKIRLELLHHLPHQALERQLRDQ